LTLFGVLGGTAALREHHGRVFEILDIPPLPGPDYEQIDLYPDALPCLHELRARGLKLGLAGNQPARTERFLGELGVDVDLVASSATWGVKSRRLRSSSDSWPSLSYRRTRSPTSVTA
jgi:FMN phosphatase YigB (HAD superfamily)